MKIIKWFVKHCIESVKWDGLKQKLTGKSFDLTDDDLELIWQMLAKENYIIGTYRSTHLTSYFICFSHFLLSVLAFFRSKFKSKIRWGKYSHILMNIEENQDPQRSKDFILVEAIGRGTTRSEFKTVFNCDRVVLLKPKATVDWDKVTETMLNTLNTPYDYNFNMNDSSKMSCVEYALNGLKSDSGFAEDFKDLLTKIKLFGNLEPSMYAESSSFEVALKIDRTNKRGVKYVREN